METEGSVDNPSSFLLSSSLRAKEQPSDYGCSARSEGAWDRVPNAWLLDVLVMEEAY